MRPKRAQNLCADVTARLGRRIVAGEIRPGEPVPTQADLCADLGVSRTTLREAVMRLHGKGLVDARPRDGVRVLPTSRWNQFDADILAWRAERGVDAALLDQLYEIRDSFEPRACSLAATRASDADRATIRRHYEDIADEHDDAARHVAADLAFHLAIFAATRNMFFISLGAAIKTALEMSFRLSQDRAAMSTLERDLHAEVSRTIVAADCAGAERAMRDLLRASRATLERALLSEKERIA